MMGKDYHYRMFIYCIAGYEHIRWGGQHERWIMRGWMKGIYDKMREVVDNKPKTA